MYSFVQALLQLLLKLFLPLWLHVEPQLLLLDLNIGLFHGKAESTPRHLAEIYFVQLQDVLLDFAHLELQHISFAQIINVIFGFAQRKYSNHLPYH